MSRKFATVSRFRIVLALMLLTILAGAASVHAQQTPGQQPPPSQQPSAPQQADTQQPSSQDTSTEEIGPIRKPKVKDYKNWTFNVGGGANLTNGNTRNFVRGGGGVAAAGVARNYSKYLGLRFDFQFDNLPLRASALQLAQAPSATSHVYSFMFDPIINIPVTKVWSGYIVAGGNFLHRSGKLDSSTAIPGSACNAFFTWWGNCFNSSLPLNKNFLSASQNEWGENFGAGVARKIRPNVEIYAEFRYLHGTHSSITTDLRPITVGVRW
jgi:opacity protein-like surface antigen